MVRLYEYEAKEILKKYNILIPEGFLIKNVDGLEQGLHDFKFPIMLKAQILAGGRGKVGGIKIAQTTEKAIKTATELFGKEIKDHKVEAIYIEEQLEIQNEFYLGITVDRSNSSFVLIFSPIGGMEIEELAKNTPEKILKIVFKPYEFQQIKLENYLEAFIFERDILLEIVAIFQKIWQILNDYDLDLIELNPCILTYDGKLYAADARANLDDNSLFRHKDFLQRKNEGLSETEIQVQERGMSYVEMNGNIGIICNGAGLVMSTMDTVIHYRGSPANFLDIGGGATRDRILFALKVISLNPKIKGILINIVGGITRCDEIAYGIIEFLKEKKDISISIRLVGTKEREGREILSKQGIPVLDTMEEAIKKIIELIS